MVLFYFSCVFYLVIGKIPNRSHNLMIFWWTLVPLDETNEDFWTLPLWKPIKLWFRLLRQSISSNWCLANAIHEYYPQKCFCFMSRLDMTNNRRVQFLKAIIFDTFSKTEMIQQWRIVLIFAISLFSYLFLM